MADALPFIDWEQIYITLFRQPYTVEFLEFDEKPLCSFVFYPPHREKDEPSAESYFVEFYIPESGISDIDTRFPHRTY